MKPPCQRATLRERVESTHGRLALPADAGRLAKASSSEPPCISGWSSEHLVPDHSSSDTRELNS